MYSTVLAYILWFLSGFGALGFHRFYLNKVPTGILWFLTGGLFMVGSIYDLITLPAQVQEANLRQQYRDALFYNKQMQQSVPRSVGGKLSKDSIEQIILRTAKRNNGVVSPSEIALEAGIPIEKARKHLEDLAENGYADLRVTKAGVIVFVFPDFNRSGEQEFESM